MDNAFYVLLGWLLGLFSPRIIELIQRPYRRAELRRSLFIELEELRRKLAALAYVLAHRSATIDRPLLEWIQPILRANRGSHEDQAAAERIGSLLRLPDDQLQAVSQAVQEIEVGLSMKKYTLPFLTSQIVSLSLFSPEFQRLALDIRALLAILNEEIDVAWFNYTKTFETISSQNHAIVRNNLVGSYRAMITICREIVDKINLLLTRKR
jgi:hypothetical protein